MTLLMKYEQARDQMQGKSGVTRFDNEYITIHIGKIHDTLCPAKQT